METETHDTPTSSQKCDCVGIRCGAHPLGLCGKPAIGAFKPGGTALKSLKRFFCRACADGLRAQVFVEPKGRIR